MNNLKPCDGSFPMNCGQSFPVNAYGKQFHCRRARVCNPIAGKTGCFRKGPREAGQIALRSKWKKIKQPRTKETFYYLCSHCSILSDDHLDVWGENVRAPGIDSAPNALSPTDVPFLDEHEVLSPHDEFLESEETRAQCLASTIRTVARRGGAIAVSAAASFMRLVRRICLPREHQHLLLEHIDNEHIVAKQRYEAQFPKGSVPPFFGTNPLPRTVETLTSAAAPTMITEKDIPYYRFRISIHNLKMRENIVDVYSARVAPLIQSMLLDPRFNHREFFCQSKELSRVYVHADTGERYFGPELRHGNRWRKLESTIPPGGNLLWSTVSMDETYSRKSNILPYQFVLGNFNSSDARKSYGTQVFGSGSILPVNKKRHTHDTMSQNDHQLAAKGDAFITSACCAMLPFEKIAEKEQTFFIGSLNKTIRVFVRCGCLAADYEETKLQAQVVGGNNCARCNGPLWAREKEEEDGISARKEQRHLMRYEKECTCTTAEQRTPEYVVRNQAKILQEVRFGTKQEASRLIQETGVTPHVEQKLHRLRNYFPHAIGSVYSATGVDLLHASMLGVESKFCVCVDAVIGAFCRTDLENFTSWHDARDRQDYRLACTPSFFSIRAFSRKCLFSNMWYTRI